MKEKVRLCCVTKNYTPTIGCGMAPLVAMVGLPNLLDSFEKLSTAPRSEKDVLTQQQKRAKLLLQTRTKIMEYEANRIIETGIQRNLRIPANFLPKIDDMVETKIGEKWYGGYKTLHKTTGNIILKKKKNYKTTIIPGTKASNRKRKLSNIK